MLLLSRSRSRPTHHLSIASGLTVTRGTIAPNTATAYAILPSSDHDCRIREQRCDLHPHTRISPHLSSDVRAIDRFENKRFKRLTVNAKRERPGATARRPVAKARFVGGEEVGTGRGYTSDREKIKLRRLYRD
jgi:hypothetical protein